MSLRKPPLPLILLNNVSCIRNAQQILRDINASVHYGGALVLMGTNGSGKYTFLRMLAGFSRPSAAHVLWNGHDITDSGVFHQYKLQLNRLSLKDALKEKFTVLDNVQWFERKRLQVARLLTIDRPIWLLDEPSVALDTKGTKLLEYIIAEHRKKEL
ncbi:hypothetical protein TB2_033725 [Malus domestica]